MTNCNSIKETLINTLKQLENEESRPENNDWRIVILQRGWVMVGCYKRVENFVTLTNASCVRTWGTTGGLGQLANQGPIAGKTILERIHGQVEFHVMVEIANIRCNLNH